MADLINITVSHPEIMFVNKTDTYGGVQYTLNFNYDVVESLRWIKEHRARLDREAKARAENPSIAEAYEQYQTVLNLVLDQV